MEQRLGVIGADDFTFKVHPSLDDAAHTLFDPLKIFRGQWTRKLKIVVEAIINRRANGNFSFGEFFKHCLRHNMCGRVADAVKL